MEISKKALVFHETELSYTSGNRTFFSLKKGIFRTLAYLELEAYSEPWHIQNLVMFRVRSIFRTLAYSEP